MSVAAPAWPALLPAEEVDAAGSAARRVSLTVRRASRFVRLASAAVRRSRRACILADVSVSRATWASSSGTPGRPARGRSGPGRPGSSSRRLPHPSSQSRSSCSRPPHHRLGWPRPLAGCCRALAPHDLCSSQVGRGLHCSPSLQGRFSPRPQCSSSPGDHRPAWLQSGSRAWLQSGSRGRRPALLPPASQCCR